MSVLKPVLIVILVILTVLIIYKANKVSTSDSSAPVRKEGDGKRTPPPPQKVPIEFFIVYMGRRVPVTHYPFTIGSKHDNDLMVTDPTVSRQHAELFLKNGKSGQVCIRDLGSLNGMTVNNVSRSEAPVRGGERIRIGQTLLQIERAIGRVQPDDGVSDDTQFIRR